jgi:hypothetical protein
MRMPQVRNDACFMNEVRQVIIGELSMQHFNGSLGVQMNMLPSVHIGKIPSPY